MTDKKNKKVLDLLTELATNDQLFKHYVAARNDPTTKDVFLKHLEELKQNFNFEEKALKILLEGNEQQIKDWIKKLVDDGKHGIWVMVYLLEPLPKEKSI